jgi:hypothetical protein
MSGAPPVARERERFAKQWQQLLRMSPSPLPSPPLELFSPRIVRERKGKQKESTETFESATATATTTASIGTAPACAGYISTPSAHLLISAFPLTGRRSRKQPNQKQKLAS